MEEPKNLDHFYNDVAGLLAQAHERARVAVNVSMVYTYFEMGRLIVEEEQHGEKRAEYGKHILEGLSDYLTIHVGKGFSVDNLRLIRKFYRVYSKDSIQETVFPESGNLPVSSTGRVFYLSWSHYLKLMRIDNISERHFYEIEATRNQWSLSELGRQFDSSLYERLALSRDKKSILKMAEGGQLVKLPEEGSTVGIVLCKEKNQSVVQMTLPEDNAQVFASKYQTVLPSRETLTKLLNESGKWSVPSG